MNKAEMEFAKDGRCKGCEYCHGVSTGDFDFLGCYCAPYKGKWVCEIKDCPKLKPCPFCGGEAKIHYRDYKFAGQNDMGDKKQKYIVQVFCNKCNSRGKPIATDWLINPSPHSMNRYAPEGTNSKKQADMFFPYILEAIKAWNERG